MLIEEINRATAAFPRDELYGLTNQMRRASVFLPLSIAEGQGRQSRCESRRFLSIVHGSLRELETQLIIAERLGFVRSSALSGPMASTGEIGRLLNALRNSPA